MNVALTRARASLFVLGHCPTLERSDSTWKEIISDARERTCLIEVGDWLYDLFDPCIDSSRRMSTSSRPQRQRQRLSLLNHLLNLLVRRPQTDMLSPIHLLPRVTSARKVQRPQLLHRYLSPPQSLLLFLFRLDSYLRANPHLAFLLLLLFRFQRNLRLCPIQQINNHVKKQRLVRPQRQASLPLEVARGPILHDSRKQPNDQNSHLTFSFRKRCGLHVQQRLFSALNV